MAADTYTHTAVHVVDLHKKWMLQNAPTLWAVAGLAEIVFVFISPFEALLVVHLDFLRPRRRFRANTSNRKENFNKYTRLWPSWNPALFSADMHTCCNNANGTPWRGCCVQADVSLSNSGQKPQARPVEKKSGRTRWENSTVQSTLGKPSRTSLHLSFEFKFCLSHLFCCMYMLVFLSRQVKEVKQDDTQQTHGADVFAQVVRSRGSPGRQPCRRRLEW